ncbi:glycosyltransferase family 2 protein [Weeksellaceae bacterium KMM 9713]|uniref:Glycosyltransferase family 2 protein n=1 Tax=Profundicola chukchiensis TaxID=2961959 RepID=A0A9X4RXL2_9FLAO|nr:glycosyltransferase family 2 protein [Profundicola chukchiensis]MDG4946649.1 glycosyltransferase family 2 protein [Profundicola chukchiensis]
MSYNLPKVSVICPVYNAEKHLKKCITSVLNQTFRDFEFILVNDKSTDQSASIIQYYTQKDSRVKAIEHEYNQGEGQSRFTGIEHSSADYLMFIDADDWYANDAIELLYTKIKKENADIVFGSFARAINEFKLFQSKPLNNLASTEKRRAETCITSPKLFDTFFHSYFGKNLLTVTMWAKIYKKETILKANVQPTHLKMGEDLSFNMQLHPFLKKACLIPDLVYYYRFGGMTSTSNPNFLRDAKILFKHKRKYIEQYNYFKALPYIHYELVNIFYSHFINLIVLDKKPLIEVEQHIRKELEDPLYSNFEHYVKEHEKGQHIVKKDISKILNYIQIHSKKQGRKHLLKRFVYNLGSF